MVAVRQTSLQAYNEIQANGLLSHMRWVVYDCLFRHGPLTAHELDKYLAKPGETKTSYHKRLSELRDMGVVAEVGERPCSITNMTAVLWDVTDKLPMRYVPQKSKAQLYREALVRFAAWLRSHPNLSTPKMWDDAADSVDKKLKEIDEG